MAGGYFDDGTGAFELGAHVFATPTMARRSVEIAPAGRAARVLDLGGGVLRVCVTAQRLRDNMGDAERWIYDRVHALAESAPGSLACEDNQGRRAVFAQSVCVWAVGRVRGFRFCDLHLEFLGPESEPEPEWGALPEPPEVYADTTTAQDYAAGGVTLGVGGEMRIEMTRSYPLREIPRARGARTRGPCSGALLRFVVTADLLDREQNLASALAELGRSIGPGPVDLTGNGSAFPGVLLRSLQPAHTDWSHTRFDAEFIQEL